MLSTGRTIDTSSDCSFAAVMAAVAPVISPDVASSSARRVPHRVVCYTRSNRSLVLIRLSRSSRLP